MKRLFRSRSDKWVSGVLGGVAEHFAVDSLIVRLVFITLVLCTGVVPFVIVYILAALWLPVGPDKGSIVSEQ